MINHHIRHIMLIVHIVHTHQPASFIFDGMLIISCKEIIIEYHYLVTVEAGKEIIEMRLLLQDHIRTDFLHLTYLVSRRVASKEGAGKISFQHVCQSQCTDKVTITDGSTGIGTEIDFFKENEMK